jgi:hypothetical protein
VLTPDVGVLLTDDIRLLSADQGIFCASDFVLPNIYSCLLNNNFKYVTPEIENFDLRTDIAPKSSQPR